MLSKVDIINILLGVTLRMSPDQTAKGDFYNNINLKYSAH